MVVQARAEATRQTIIAAAVDLFDEVGYGNTGLADIIGRAGVTKGGFYYHFATKEAVATAIIEDAAAGLHVAFNDVIGSRSASALENLIRAMFVVNDITRQDKRVRVANLLRQALHQVSPAGPATYAAERGILVAGVVQAIAEGDISDDLDPDEVAQTIWAAALGTLLLAEATADDVFTRLAQVWMVILRGIVPVPSREYFLQFVARLADQYTPPG